MLFQVAGRSDGASGSLDNPAFVQLTTPVVKIFPNNPESTLASAIGLSIKIYVN
jgi:hypothetical protein